MRLEPGLSLAQASVSKGILLVKVSVIFNISIIFKFIVPNPFATFVRESTSDDVTDNWWFYVRKYYMQISGSTDPIKVASLLSHGALPDYIFPSSSCSSIILQTEHQSDHIVG